MTPQEEAALGSAMLALAIVDNQGGDGRSERREFVCLPDSEIKRRRTKVMAAIIAEPGIYAGQAVADASGIGREITYKVRDWLDGQGYVILEKVGSRTRMTATIAGIDWMGSNGTNDRDVP